MREFLFSNFGQTILVAEADPGDATLLIRPSDAPRFPDPGLDQCFAVILNDGLQEPEVVWVIANPGNGEWDVLRGQEGTPQGRWRTGTAVLHTHTAASLEWFVTGGQILWKSQYDAALAALEARIAAAEQKNNEQDEDQTSQTTNLEAQIETAHASIQEKWLVWADFSAAQAQINQTLSVDLANFHGELTTFKSVQATNNEVQAQHIVTLYADTGTANAKATQALNATAATDSALATAKTNLEASIAGNSAQISALQSADVNNYEALSQQINVVSANYGTLNATVTEKSFALANLTGDVTGFYGVKIDANGTFGGFEVMVGSQNGVAVNYMNVTTGMFYIQAPGSTFMPFVFDANTGRVYLQYAWIDGAYIHDLTVGTLKIAGYAVTGPKVARDEITWGNSWAGPLNQEVYGGEVELASIGYTPVGGRLNMRWFLRIENTHLQRGDIRLRAYCGASYLGEYPNIVESQFITGVPWPVSAHTTPGSPVNIRITAYAVGTSVPLRAVEYRLDIDDFRTEA